MNYQNTVDLENPIIYSTVKEIKYYIYELNNIITNTSVSYKITCLTEQKEFVKVLFGVIEGEEYLAWGNDDSYIENLIKQKVLELS
jgi:hypothetical protein